jgi:hypothetical protein
MTNLERRARRLEEEAELREQAKQAEAERVLREALRHVSTPELQAMGEYFERTDREDWSEEDEPLMRRLVALMEEQRREEAGEFPWRSETEAREE